MRFWEWLLGLERIRLESGAPLSLRFATPPAPWIMLVGAVAAAMLILRLVRHLKVKTRWKFCLFLLRWGAVMSVLFIIGQPMLVLTRTVREPSRVEILVDQSASMSVKDGDSKADESAIETTSRWQKAQGLIAPGTPFRKSLGEQEANLWTFAQDAERCKGNVLPSATDSSGQRTDIAAALSRVLDSTQFANVSALVLISDGQQTITDQLSDAIDSARERAIPIHVIGVGSSIPLCDIRVDDVWADEQVFVQDVVTIRVQVGVQGVAPGTKVQIELRDKESAQLLSSFSRTMDADGGHIEAELDYRPIQVGVRTLVVTALTLEAEKNTSNNSAEVKITAHDRKVRVLYVEGLPRFEYRFLKNLLIREPSIDSSCLLLGATADFPQEGSSPVRRFPTSMEELSRYDVIVLGDVDPRADDWMTPAQQIMIADFVSNLGGGVAFIAGERNMPQRLRGTTLEKLLPVRIDPQFSGRYERTLQEPYTPQLTPEGKQSLLFHVAPTKEETEKVMSALPGWYYAARVLGPQPAALVLAVDPNMEGENGPLPVAVLGRYGAGRTFYLGSDDLWRWREYQAEHVYENVWLQAIRALARGRKLGHDTICRLDTDRRQYNLGDMAQVRLTVLDQALMHGIDEVDVEVRSNDELIDRVKLRSSTNRAGALEGMYACTTPGKLTLQARDKRLESGAAVPACDMEVMQVDREMQQVAADAGNLSRIAEATGGKSLWSTDDLSALAASLPDRSIERPSDIEEPIWDTRLMAFLLVGLLSTEWILRRSLSLP